MSNCVASRVLLVAVALLSVMIPVGVASACSGAPNFVRSLEIRPADVPTNARIPVTFNWTAPPDQRDIARIVDGNGPVAGSWVRAPYDANRFEFVPAAPFAPATTYFLEDACVEPDGGFNGSCSADGGFARWASFTTGAGPLPPPTGDPEPARVSCNFDSCTSDGCCGPYEGFFLRMEGVDFQVLNGFRSRVVTYPHPYMQAHGRGRFEYRFFSRDVAGRERDGTGVLTVTVTDGDCQLSWSGPGAPILSSSPRPGVLGPPFNPEAQTDSGTQPDSSTPRPAGVPGCGCATGSGGLLGLLVLPTMLQLVWRRRLQRRAPDRELSP